MKRLLPLLALLLAAPLCARAQSPSTDWARLCARCHGETGDGHTPIGRKLRIKDYTDPSVQAAFSDAGLFKNLMLGVSTEAGGDRMPAFRDRLSVDEAKALVALIRSFAAAPARH